MKASIQSTISLPISGGTGYANRSSLSLHLEGIGAIALPYDEWDLSGMEDMIATKLKKLVLGIPSGTLTLDENISVLLKDGEFKISGKGSWDGSFAGFVGGMSGYCSFEGAFLSIQKGTYKLTSDRKACGYGYNDPYSLEPAKYFERISRHRAGLNYPLAIEDAREAARIQSIAWSDRTEDDRTFLQEWDKGIIDREKLSPEEFIASVNDRTLELGGFWAVSDLPLKVIQKLREANPEEEALTSDSIFAEEQGCHTSWNPISTEIRWAISARVGEDFHNWWASPEESDILNKWEKEPR